MSHLGVLAIHTQFTCVSRAHHTAECLPNDGLVQLAGQPQLPTLPAIVIPRRFIRVAPSTASRHSSARASPCIVSVRSVFEHELADLVPRIHPTQQLNASLCQQRFLPRTERRSAPARRFYAGLFDRVPFNGAG